LSQAEEQVEMQEVLEVEMEALLFGVIQVSK
jgi:hypothetical protein